MLKYFLLMARSLHLQLWTGIAFSVWPHVATDGFDHVLGIILWTFMTATLKISLRPWRLFLSSLLMTVHLTNNQSQSAGWIILILIIINLLFKMIIDCQALKVRNYSIMGWSDGSMIGLIMAAQYPSRIRRMLALTPYCFNPKVSIDNVKSTWKYISNCVLSELIASVGSVAICITVYLDPIDIKTH